MPRDSSGIYVLPSGNPVVTGTTVESDWANDTMADIQAALTDSLSRTGNGGMQTAFKVPDGTEGTPALAFTDSPTTGIWRDSNGEVVVSIAGTEVFRVKSDNTVTVNDVVLQEIITGAATTITDTDLTINRALIANGSGKVAVSPVTSTELALLSGLGSGDVGFPAGTKMLFVQTAAPTGWTKDATHDNKALRVVSGTASNGGSVAFTTAFSSARTSNGTVSTGTVAGHTLTIAEMPSHSHSLYVNRSGADSGTNSTVAFGVNSSITGTNFMDSPNQAYPNGGGGSHSHGLTMDSHTHDTNLAVQYVDCVICTKD